VTFRVLPLDQLGDREGSAGQIETLRKVVVSMGDLVDENDQPISYSDEIRDQLIQFFVRLALLKAYIEAMSKMKTGTEGRCPPLGGRRQTGLVQRGARGPRIWYPRGDHRENRGQER
jgi:hypothetical protein